MGQRARTVSQLVSELRAELRMGSNAALGTNMRDTLVQSLRRAQEEIYTAFDWPFLQSSVEVPIVPETTRYAIPDAVDPAEVQRVFFRETAGTPWVLLTPNRMPSDGAPDDGVDVTTPRRWWTELDVEQNVEQIVIWPKPNTDAIGTLMVRGKHPLLPFVDDSDRSTLDGTLLVLAAAAEHLADAKSNRAQAVQAKAERRFKQLKANMGAGRRAGYFMIGKPRTTRLPKSIAQIGGFQLDGSLME